MGWADILFHRLYELVDTRDAVDKDETMIAKLRTFNSGLTAFEAKVWGDAEGYFQKVLSGFPDDGPAKYYVERCKAFKKRPPKPEWDGVFNLQKK